MKVAMKSVFPRALYRLRRHPDLSVLGAGLPQRRERSPSTNLVRDRFRPGAFCELSLLFRALPRGNRFAPRLFFFLLPPSVLLCFCFLYRFMFLPSGISYSLSTFYVLDTTPFRLFFRVNKKFDSLPKVE